MTNILAWITFEIVTNWTTISRTVPICHMDGCLVYHAPMINQTGVGNSNTVVNFSHEGKAFRVVVKTEFFSLGTNSVRTIPEMESLRGFMNLPLINQPK